MSPSSPLMPETVAGRYRDLVKQSVLEPDSAQEEVVAHLDVLRDAVADYRLARKSSPLGWLFRAGRPVEPPDGLYIHGPVGRGKTMLMDLFFDSVRTRRKRRAHFHVFMADVHVRIHAWRGARKRGDIKGEDPIAPVAEDLAAEAWLLCFDEFAVNDIADAMILGRLFQALFSRGVVVVATSNVAPDDLYREGLNRALFLPFIAILQERMEVVSLEARTDFRLEKLKGAPVWHVPADGTAKAALTRVFAKLAGREYGTPTTVRVLGRDVPVPEAAQNIARFSFSDLCDAPLGATDFVAIARRFDVVLIDAIPVIEAGQRNVAKRFINLVDALYDNQVKLVASAAAEPEALYLGRDNREAFEFARTASRLTEMRSAEYFAQAKRSAMGESSGHATGLVDT